MKKTKFVLDETDENIIKLLTNNARMSYKEVSKRLKEKNLEMTPAGIGKRISKLLKNKIINFTLQKDYQKMGFSTPLILLIQIQYMPFQIFIQTLKNMHSLQDPRIQSVFTISGTYNLGIIGIWQNKEEYGLWKSKFLDEFLKESKKEIILLNEILIWDYYKKQGDDFILIPHHLLQDHL